MIAVRAPAGGPDRLVVRRRRLRGRRARGKKCPPLASLAGITAWFIRRIPRLPLGL